MTGAEVDVFGKGWGSKGLGIDGAVGRRGCRCKGLGIEGPKGSWRAKWAGGPTGTMVSNV